MAIAIKGAMKERRASGKQLTVAVFIIAVTYVYLFAVTFIPMTPEGADQAKTITGFLLGTGLGTLLGFYWGGTPKKEAPPEEGPAE